MQLIYLLSQLSNQVKQIFNPYFRSVGYLKLFFLLLALDDNEPDSFVNRTPIQGLQLEEEIEQCTPRTIAADDEEDSLPSTKIQTPKRTIPKRKTTKLRNSALAAADYAEYLKEKNRIKESYYSKKLEIMGEMVAIKKAKVAALENITATLQEFL